MSIFLFSSLYVHLRGRVRFALHRQLLSFATFLGPINGFMYLFSAAPNRPFLDLEKTCPELNLLRDNWEVFRDEARGLDAADTDPRGEAGSADIAFNSFLRCGWRRFYLKWYDEPQPSAEVLCPRAVAMINQVPGIKAAMFAVLPPGGTLMRHRDPYAGSLRYRLAQPPGRPGWIPQPCVPPFV